MQPRRNYGRYTSPVQQQHLEPKPPAAWLHWKCDNLLGTTEYVIKNNSLYIRGIAVHPLHRDCGVCRSLVDKAIAVAREAGLKKLSLSAIEETGNTNKADTHLYHK